MASSATDTEDSSAETLRVKGFRQRLNRHKEHLTDRDLDAARRELRGETFYKYDGTPADHVGEVRGSQRGLRNLIRDIQGVLSDVTPGRRPSPGEVEAMNQVLAEASRLIDYSRGFVP